MSTTTPGSLVIKHPNTMLRINMRNGRIYITMSTGNTKTTMALTADEALALSTYLQTKAQLILSRGGFIGVRGASTSTTKAKASKAGKKAEAKGGEEVTAPKQVEDVGDEDIGVEEE